MSNIDKQALNQEKIEWLNKLADMEYCKSNPGHWLMSLKDTNMLAKLALRSVAMLDELEAAEKRIAELEAREVVLPSTQDVHPLGPQSAKNFCDFHRNIINRCAYEIRKAGVNVSIKGE